MKNRILRFLSFILFFFIFSFVVHGQQTLIQVDGWNAYVHLPSDYDQTSKNYPTIIFFPGVGEVGSNANKVIQYGPGAYLQQGWNGETLGVKFIVISLQPTSTWPGAATVKVRVDKLKSLYRIGDLYVTGLSMGGYCSTGLSMNYPDYVKGYVGVEPASYYEKAELAAIIGNVARSGQKYLLFEQIRDNRSCQILSDLMNAVVPGSATLQMTNFGGGGHCCWSEFYGGGGKAPGIFNLNGIDQNLYEWIARKVIGGGEPTNIPPTANAGTDVTITLPQNSVTLNGSGSDPDGSIASYEWTKTSGPATFNIASPSSASTEIKNLVEGTYQFQLKVTDNKGATATASVKVVVNPATNQPPTANAGSDVTITLPQNSVTLNGSGTDPDGSIASYEWTKTSGPATFNIASPASASTEIKNLVEGTYQFQLKVTDNKGATATATVKVIVNPAPSQPPVANAGSDVTIQLPTDSVELNGSGEPKGSPINLYEWSQVSGPAAATFTNNKIPTTKVENLKAGEYVFALKVTDLNGLSSVANVKVTVNATQSPGDCGCDVIMPRASDSSIYYTKDSKQGIDIKPGDRVCIKAGKYPQITIRDVNGTPDKPITFINCGGQVLISNGTSWNISIGSSSYFRFTGTGDPNYKYGFKIKWDGGQSGNGVGVGGVSTSYEIDHIEMHNVGVGFFCKVDPVDCQPNTWGQNFTVKNISLHDNYVQKTFGEGFYIMNTSPTERVKDCSTGQYIDVEPVRADGVKIYNNIVDSTGWDGIQLVGAYNSAIYNNRVTHYALSNVNGQNYGIIFGGKSQGNVYNNFVAYGSGTGMGITPYGRTLVYNNVVAHTGSGDRLKNIGFEDRPNPDNKYTGLQIYLFNNTLIDGNMNVRINNSFGTVAKGHLAYNNIFVAPIAKVNVEKSPYLYFDYDLDIDTANNLTFPNIADVGFVNPDALDFHLLPTSPAINKGRDLSAYGVTTDIEGLSRPQGSAYDVGAYEYNENTPPPNQKPVANAGADQVIKLPLNKVTVNGSGTDRDGTIAGYAWKYISGPVGAVIVNNANASTEINSLQTGVYIFELTVTDDKGDTGKDSIKITVKSTNTPPVANAGADKVITLPVNSVSLQGSGSDADGSIASYKWEKIAGPSQYSITTPGGANTTVTNLAEGIYLFSLTVTDNEGATGRDTVKVTVNAAPNQAPLANAGTDQTITLPTNTVSLSGSGSDADGKITSYQWSKISGPSTFTIVSPSSAATVVSGLVAGVYEFQLKVTDDKGATAADVVKVTVNEAPNKSPVANAGPDRTITLPTNITSLAGSGSDADGKITSYKWSKISGPSAFSIVNPASPVTDVSGLVAGVYEFELRVTDDRGASATDVMRVVVNDATNKTPIANAGTDQTITLPTNTTSLAGSGSDADGKITAYKWTKISGPSSFNIVNPSSAITDVTGLTEGVYEFELKVTDDKGATATDIVKITVNAAPNKAPVANAGNDQTITLPANSITLTGSGSDADGKIVSYQWIKINGPATYNFVNATSPVTDVSGLVAGVYEFQLKVTDDKGATGTDVVKITVNAAPNKAPVANAGPDRSITLPVNSIVLNGSGVASGGGTIQYSWAQISGPAMSTISNINNASTEVKDLVAGNYLFQLTVKDKDGGTGVDVMQLTVNIQRESIPDSNIAANIKIYPNPTPDIATLEVIGAKGNEKLVMRVTDVNGRVIERKEITTTVNVVHKEVIDLARYSKGVYIISLSANGQVRVARKILKIR